ncbi:S-layer homology domain-containing protein [Domibacillus sp. A3M-37]|uniref:S-layer homology domain-containing protein n=1 Tax=Domibacillus sp. A3M-37 TaxID=2962037 RepID=UPI0020B88CAC|nr:S-layer homology domain-containing protein [Domibacillus sp. A3M-37]MCP3760933.1 S-layer homology domain-containing protein [Domibacillus sp. A3M-37]
MNKYSFFTAATAATVTVASFSAPASAAYEHPFTDVGDRYGEAVEFLYMIEAINGVSSTKFGTQQTLTRGDAAVILANMLGMDTESAPDAGFTDLNSRVKPSVNALAEYGIVSGVTATEFKPGQPLSRGAMAKFLVTAFELEEYAEETPFTDVGGVFAPYIEALYGTGITNGKTATSYGTNQNITRGEFANLLYGTVLFDMENSYYPVAVKATVISATSTQIVLEEAAPEDYTARDIADMFFFSVDYSDGTQSDFDPTSFTLSKDRTTLTIRHEDLTGKKGTMQIDDWETVVEAPFDFTPVTTTSSANVDGSFEQPEDLPATEAAQ